MNRFKQYSVGQRIELTRMDDKYAPPLKTQGTITFVNVIGEDAEQWCQLSVKWDNGSRLMVCLPDDEVTILE